jgi:hypothetical protein
MRPGTTAAAVQPIGRIATVPCVNRRRLASGAFIAAAVAAGVGAFVFTRLHSGHAALPAAPPSTTTTVFTFDAPVGRPNPIDPTTAPVGKRQPTAGRSGKSGAGTTTTTNPGTAKTGGTKTSPIQPAVTWKLTGSCSGASSTFTCRVTVTASDGLRFAGFVTVYPNRGYGPGCEQSGPLVRNAVTVSGACQLPRAPAVLAVYSLAVHPSVDEMARGYLPWT